MLASARVYRRRVASLDGLRAVSIAFVLLGHLIGTAGYPVNGLTYALFGYARFGVQTFFVISGYLITTLLLEEHRAWGRIDLGAFYKRRALRILPASFVYIVFATLIRLGTHHPLHWKHLVYALTYTSCYAHDMPWILTHLWSLSVEEQFYLLWPTALVLAFSARRRICWAVMVMAPACRLWYAAHDPHLAEYAFPAVADALAAGCLLALYGERLPKRSSKLCHGAIFLLVSELALTIPFWNAKAALLLDGAGALLIALAVHIAIQREDWILNNRPIAFVGVISYSLYLYQQPFLTQGQPLSLDRLSAFPVNIALAALLALASYFLVERRFLRYRTAPAPNPAKAPLPSAAL